MTKQTHQELLDAALTLKEMAEFFAAGMCLDESTTKKNPAILAAEKLATYHQQQAEYESSSAEQGPKIVDQESSSVPNIAMPVPAMVPVESSEPKKLLELGIRAIGRVKYDMKDQGFTHVQVVQILDSGELYNDVDPVAYVDVFLHIKALPESVEKPDVSEGCLVSFVVVAGQKDGQIAAGDAQILQSCESDQVEEVT